MLEIDKHTNVNFTRVPIEKRDGMKSNLQKLHYCVEGLSLSREVVDLVIPNGRPHDVETQLWDYKRDIPILKSTPSEADRTEYRSALSELLKDAVAFHNAFGGYLVFGVSEDPKNRIPGCSDGFDCGDFNKRLHAYTDSNVECLFTRLPVSDEADAPLVGLLLVPKRPSNMPPVKFRKKSGDRTVGGGGPAFSAETYVRVRDECRPAAATADDWKFLLSDREVTDDAGGPKVPRRPIHTLLPARDPDLIRFVGRGESLAYLREWLLDHRSPVRLVTGIGGLGKTTLAYRFAEEVAEIGSDEIEWIIWVTAKQQTYSALRGKLVATNTVDFTDLKDLLVKILDQLSYEIVWEDEEPNIDELTERLVEALSIYSCLIVIDDLDSLPPDEQRETVAAFNAIALRTVGRDIAPSRVLFTSRIDQGLPPTAVHKISGLSEVDFNTHLENLFDTFKIARLDAKITHQLFDVASGSPLFAASIVRLIKLGINPRELIETWKGQDGEEVRRFAFEREINRLDTQQSRLLYAVLLLGETSVADVAEVLEITQRMARDRISELQAYHLISTATKNNGDSTIFAPDELVAISTILKNHLGTDATSVERACARAREVSRTDDRTIGSKIRQIVAAWNANRLQEALVMAKELKSLQKKNGDVANILGQAYLRTSPPDFKNAHQEFREARRLGCIRPELVGDLIRTKIELEDWLSLYELTKSLSSRSAANDEPLMAFLRATDELIVVARQRGDYGREADLCLSAVEKIMAKTTRIMLQPAFFTLLARKRNSLAHSYISALEHLNPRPGDKLVVFEGVYRLAELGATLPDLVMSGLRALRTWWTDVEKRPVVDLAACSILGNQIRRLERIERQLEVDKNHPAQILEKIVAIKRDLSHRGATLASSI